jgi:hypothetical protein
MSWHERWRRMPSSHRASGCRDIRIPVRIVWTTNFVHVGQDSVTAPMMSNMPSLIG